MPAAGTLRDVPGLVVALPAEARSIGARGARTGSCVRWQNGWLAVSGVGPHNALRATERLLACGVTGIANWGVAGALDSSLVPGDVLVPERIRCASDATGFTPDPDACARLIHACGDRLRLGRGVLWSAPTPIATQADKRALRAASGALAVDMEAASIAAVAHRAGIPFVALKVICDPATREVPARVAQALDAAAGGVSLRMLAAIALGGPATWRSVRDLARDFASARRVLATAAALAA